MGHCVANLATYAGCVIAGVAEADSGCSGSERYFFPSQCVQAAGSEVGVPTTVVLRVVAVFHHTLLGSIVHFCFHQQRFYLIARNRTVETIVAGFRFQFLSGRERTVAVLAEQVDALVGIVVVDFIRTAPPGCVFGKVGKSFQKYEIRFFG